MLKPFAKRVVSALRYVRDYNPELAYLNEASDVIDLERRQREIDHGMFRRRPYSF